MEEFGGLYADLDVELLRDVEPELPAHGGVWTVAGWKWSVPLETHMWVSQPGHPFWPVLRRQLHARHPRAWGAGFSALTDVAASLASAVVPDIS